MTFSLKIKGIDYDLWVGENAAPLILQALGASIENGAIDLSTAIFDIQEYSKRMAIADIIFQECEFTPDFAKTEENVSALIRRINIELIVNFIPVYTDFLKKSSELMVALKDTEELKGQQIEALLKDRGLSGEVAIVAQPDLIQESAIAHSEMPTITG